MPYAGSRSKRSYKKRPYRKPKTTRRTTHSRRGGTMALRSARPTVQRGYQPFGLTMYTRQVYAKTVEFLALSAGGTTAASTFRLNSMFDPSEDPLVSDQPQQFDQVSSLYANYVVYGCMVDVIFNNPTTDGVYVGIRLRNGANSLTSIGRGLDDIREFRDVQSRPLNNSGSQKARFRIYVPINILLGVSKATLHANLEQYGATVTSDPVATGLLDVWACTITGATADVHAHVKLRYHCKYYNSKSVGGS